MGLFGCFFGHQFDEGTETEEVVLGKAVTYTVEPGTNFVLNVLTAKEHRTTQQHGWCSRCKKMVPMSAAKFSRLARYTSVVIPGEVFRTNRDPRNYFVPGTLTPTKLAEAYGAKYFDLTKDQPLEPLTVPFTKVEDLVLPDRKEHQPAKINIRN